MNVFDFDKTLYPRDSTLEFYLVSLLRHPSFLLDLPRTLLAFLKQKRGKISLQRLREISLSSFRRLRDPEGEAERFWKRRRHRLFPYYEEIRRPDDVVISASPEFLLRPIAREVGFGCLIASQYDPRTGKYLGERCWGEGKPPLFRAAFPDGHIEAFYSDSLSDTPMARLADTAYLIKKGTPVPWPEDSLQ